MISLKDRSQCRPIATLNPAALKNDSAEQNDRRIWACRLIATRTAGSATLHWRGRFRDRVCDATGQLLAGNGGRRAKPWARYLPARRAGNRFVCGQPHTSRHGCLMQSQRLIVSRSGRTTAMTPGCGLIDRLGNSQGVGDARCFRACRRSKPRPECRPSRARGRY